MYNDPASPAQRELAEALGIELPLGATVAEASEAISHAPASAQQYAQAQEVGIELPDTATYQEAKRQLKDAYVRAGKRVVTTMKIKVGDLLLKDGDLWEVKNLFNGYRISLKPVLPVRQGRKVVFVPTGRGKVFNAFTFRTAMKIDPQIHEF